MDDITFQGGPARRPTTITEPILQWATGLETVERSIYVGWLCEHGIHDALDEAMAAAGFATVTIKHGNGNRVQHWAIQTANLFVICQGVQTISEMKFTAERHGIAFGWRTPEGGRAQSVLRARCLLHELLAVSYLDPITVSVKSTLTGDLITALCRQYEVLDHLDALRAPKGKPGLPYYALSLPIGPGREVARGTVQTKQITPMEAKVPATIDRAYVRSHVIERDWIGVVESLLPDAITWSANVSKLIAAGEEGTGARVEDRELA